MNVRLLPLILGTVAVLSTATVLLFLVKSPASPEQEGVKVLQRGSVDRRQEPPSGKNADRTSSSAKIVSAGDDDGLSEGDRQLLDCLAKAVDDENFDGVRALARRAGEIANPVVRKELVTALGQFGRKSLGHLEPFFNDSDDEVATWAVDDWKAAIAEVDEDSERIGILEKAVDGTENPNALDAIFTEYIRMDEALAEKALKAIIARGGTAPAMNKARETYVLITGKDSQDGESP